MAENRMTQGMQRPSEWKRVNNWDFVRVECDTLSASYLSRGSHQEDFGWVQSDYPIPKELDVYYFEITVVSVGDYKQVTIGLAPKEMRQLQLGTALQEIGFCPGRRKFFKGSARGSVLPTSAVESGDVIGCGLDSSRAVVFFTMNGQQVYEVDFGAELHSKGSVFYPTVTMHSEDEAIRANFGKAPFEYNLDAYIEARKQARLDEVTSVDVESYDLIPLIKDYLCYRGFEDALTAFEQETACPLEKNTSNEFRDTSQMAARKEVKNVILSGKPEKALQLLQEHFPGVAKLDGLSIFRLHTLGFIELLREKKVGAAVDFARKHLTQYLVPGSKKQAYMEPVLHLLALPEADDASLYMHREYRKSVAEVVNKEILQTLYTNCSEPAVVHLTSKLFAVVNATRDYYGGRGERLDLEEFAKTDVG